MIRLGRANSAASGGHGGLTLLFVALVVLAFADPLFSGRSFAGRDLLGYHLPIEKVVHDAYSRGKLPVWIDEISGGRPLLANPNVGALYPVRPLLSRFSFPAAMRLFPVFHWALAGAGMIVWLRSLSLSRPAAWLGAVTYVFSGVGVSEVFYTNLHPGVAMLPWILWSFRRAAEGGRRWVVVLAIFLSADVFAGDVFTLGIGILATLFWTTTEVARAQRGRAGLRIAAGLGLAVLLALPQIVATLCWAPLTRRAVLGMTIQESFFFSLRPWRLLELVIPFPFGATWDLDAGLGWAPALFSGRAVGFFTSLYAGALAPIAVVWTWRSRAIGLRFSRAFLAAGLLLSILPGLAPSNWANRASPLPLRYPEKFAIASAFALAIIAAQALEALRREGRSIRWVVVSGGLFAVMAGVAAAFPAGVARIASKAIGQSVASVPLAAAQIPGAIAEAGLFWLATGAGLLLAQRGSRNAVFLGLAILTLVPVAASRRIAPTYEEEILSPSPFARRLQKADPPGSYRALGESPFTGPARTALLLPIEVRAREWASNTQALWGRGTVLNGDFDEGDFSRTESLRRVASMASRNSESSAFFSALALRWGIRYRNQKPVTGFRRFGGDGMQDWDELPGTYPDIRLLEEWTEETDVRKIIGDILRGSQGAIVLESGVSKIGHARPGHVTILARSPERLELETTSPDPTWLFVLRGYWSYRRVLVDDRVVESVPAQIAFSAVPVPAGRHRVKWRESIPGGVVAGWGPMAFLSIAAILVFSAGRS
jgi:hypothetical protein